MQRMWALIYSLSRENSYFLHCKNSQEIPVRIDIVFCTSKEELTLVVAGKKQSRKRPLPNFLGSPSLSLHICLPQSHLHFLGRRVGRHGTGAK